MSVINISTSSAFLLVDCWMWGSFFAGLLRSAPLKCISGTICGPFIGVITIYAIDAKQFSF